MKAVSAAAWQQGRTEAPDVDPVGMVRSKGRSRSRGLLDQHVNDRPYVASSFMSVAIAKLYGTALQGKCAAKPELVEMTMPLEARIAVLPSGRPSAR